MRPVERCWHPKDKHVATFDIDMADLNTLHTRIQPCVKYLQDSTAGGVRQFADDWGEIARSSFAFADAVYKVATLGVCKRTNVFQKLVLVLVSRARQCLFEIKRRGLGALVSAQFAKT